MWIFGCGSQSRYPSEHPMLALYKDFVEWVFPPKSYLFGQKNLKTSKTQYQNHSKQPKILVSDPFGQFWPQVSTPGRPPWLLSDNSSRPPNARVMSDLTRSPAAVATEKTQEKPEKQQKYTQICTKPVFGLAQGMLKRSKTFVVLSREAW